MKILIALLIISIIGNFIGLFVLYKFFKKNEYLAEVEATVERKDVVLQKVSRMLPKRLAFIHHSVGRNWLNDGLRDELMAEGISVQSISRNCDLGSETDMNHWIPKFSDHINEIISFDSYEENNISTDKENDIIMFKSCYPNSDIAADGTPSGDPFAPEKTISNYQAIFDSLKNIFAEQPNKTFIYVTFPPIHQMNTTAENASRARKFNNWIKSEFADFYSEETGLNNFVVFDLFDVLADENNFLKEEYVRREGDSHPNTKGNRAATRVFMDFYKSKF